MFQSAFSAMAWAAMLLLGSVSGLTFAQIVAAPGSGAQVIQTQNGLNQVNIARPSGSGVSTNNFSQFDVPAKGAILNNSPVSIQTQQAGYISGNGNLTPGNSAKIIVNQVMSNAPSQLHGYLEVAGPKAEVVVANPNGLVIDGAGFINTSRTILTTGTPNYGPNGSLAGFNVTGGTITVKGAGLNATNVDQVDLLSRAIQINAAVYANNLNAIAGSNQIDYNTLAATPIAGNGPAPSVAIDVSALGGMYANRIFLVSNEYGVGVSTKGVLAAQAGDLTLQSNGKLVLAGTTNASGNINASAAQGIDNNGTTYAQGNVNASTSGALTNSGTLAAQQNATLDAGGVSSTGTLGAGVNVDGSIAQSGNLTVSSTGAIAANGRNAAGGNATIQGAAVNLAGSSSTANGDLGLAATAGDINLTGATTTAGGSLSAKAAGTLTNDNGALKSGRAQTITAGALSNRNGQMIAGDVLTENIAGAVQNQGGTMQAAGAFSMRADSLDNSAGHLTSLNADGLSIHVAGLLNNAQNGVIGGNGNVIAQAGQLANAGSITAVQDLTASATQALVNFGTLAANGDASASAGTTLTNAGSLSAGQTVRASAATLDNSGGTITGDQVALTAANLANRNGSITQTGAGATTLAVSNTLDNTNGTIETNAPDLTLAPAAILNDNGKITSAGAGALSITTSSLSNNGGTIATNGALVENVSGAISNQGGAMQAGGALSLRAGSLDNTSGSIASLGTGGVALDVAGLLNNARNGAIGGNGSVIAQAGQLVNAGSITAVQSLIASAVQTVFNSGTLAANGEITVSAGTTLTNAGTITGNQLALSAFDLVNRSGSITQTGTGATAFIVSGTLDNTSGSIQTNAADLTLAPAALVNDNGTIASSGNGTLSVSTSSLSNTGGTIATNGALAVTSGVLSNRGGTLAAQTSATLDVASLDNRAGGYVGAQNVSINDTGALDNTNGTLQANNSLAVTAQSITNDNGSIANGGAGATTVTASAALTNTNNGFIGGNGDVSVSGASVDNSGGTLVAGGALAAQSMSGFTNRAGLIQGNTGVSLGALGAIDNTGGQIEADGDSAALSVAGASIDNTNGRIANTGSGASTLNAASITNSNTDSVAGAGTIGGNGDVTLNAQVLSNTNGAQVLAGHDLALNLAQWADNTNATLSGANALTLNGANAALLNAGGSIHANGALGLNAASIDNTNGRIGNDQGSGGSVSIATGMLANQNGAIGSDQNLSLVTNTLTGDGRMIAGNDGAVTINGDYTLDGVNQIQANHDLTFTTTGDFANQGTLAAVNALTVNARNIDNQALADLNSASTTLNAANAITNEGRIEGDTVTTTSATLVNTATIIGNTVTLMGTQSIMNTGAAAVMAAASQLNLYSSGDISNTQGANVFSLGDIDIAGDATRDANGVLANRANTVTNDQSTIEAQGNIEVAANTLNNTRAAVTVETVTTDVDTVHQTKRQKYTRCATNYSGSCSNWNDYKTPFTRTFSDADVVSSSDGANAVDRVLVVNVNGTPTTIYYNTLTKNSDATITVVFWDAYDPHINYDPASEYPTRDDAHNGWERVEIARDTTTTKSEDQISGTQAQQAQLLAGGTMTLANVGTINNAYSAIAAGDAIRIGGAVQNGTIDASGNGNIAGTIVNNIGQTLYQYQRQDIESTYAWNVDIGQDVGKVKEPSIVLAPVAFGGTGGTIIANNAIVIDALDVNNVNVAAANSATGATGGTLGANTAMAPVSGGSAASVNAAGGASSTVSDASGPATSAATGNGARIDAPQSVAGPTGAMTITLPTSGLYHIDTSPSAAYLIATDPRLTSYASFISSDYMLKALNLDPAKTEKRLGDGLYEVQLIRNQITQLTGRVYLQGYTSNEDEYRALMTNGVNYAKEFNLTPGLALSAAQMDALTSDIVWLVDQVVTLPDGATQHVLAPVVYLAQAHANDLQPSGALIAADDVEIHATGSVTNSGVIKGGTQTVISATDILNRGGSIGSSSANGTTVVSATNDVVNASGRISGNRVAVLAGHDIVNTTLVDTVGVSSAAGNSKVTQTLVGAQGAIESTGDMMVAAGHDLTVHGATLNAGGDAQITAGNDIVVDAVQSSTSQSVTKSADHHWEENTLVNQTSGIGASGSLAMQSGNDMTFKGASVSAGKDMTVVAGGNLTATTVTNALKSDNVATDDRDKRVGHDYDEQAVGTSFSAGGNATLKAVSTDKSQGNVTLTGSSLSADTGAAGIVSTGDVTLNEAREEHDRYADVHSERGSVIKKTTTDDVQNAHANIGVGSTVSGDSVNINAGHDVSIAGSTVAATNDVSLVAGHDLTVTTTQDINQSSHFHEEKKTGFGTAGVGISYGTVDNKDTVNDANKSAQGSLIGSTTGNVTMQAGNTLHITGSDVLAAGNVTGTGAEVIVDASQTDRHHDETHEMHSSGVTLAFKSSVIDAIQTAGQQAQAAGSGSGNARVDTLHALAAGGSLINGASPLASGKTPDWKVELSAGSSSSKSTFTEDSTQRNGSSITAGGTATFVATGNGTSGSGNVTIAGSNVNASDVVLAANNQVNLRNSTDTDSTRSNNESKSGSIGVSYGSSGYGIEAAGSKAHGDANSDSTAQTNTHISGTNSVSIVSGGDTNIKGATVDGGQVSALIGGDLNIASVQDTSHSAAHQESQSAGVSISQAGGSASYSSQHGDAHGDYAGVEEQSGIHAGAGGFDINVKGNTDLKGGYIASDADASRNALTTGTLTFSDITNASNYNAKSSGFSAGGSMGGSSSAKANGVTSLSDGGGVSPMISQHDSGNETATTKSAIGAGTITITDGANQKQDIASLNRDTADLNGTVSKLPDLSNLLNQQASTQQAAAIVAQTVATQIGNYADRQKQAAEAAGDQETADKWKEGGAYRIAMHIAGGAAVAGLGGGSIAGGAAGAGISAAAAGKLNDLSEAIATSSTTGNADADKALGNIIANVIATGAGAAVGGGSGAMTASNADLYNRQLHQDSTAKEKTLAKKLADESGGKYTEQQIEDQMAQMNLKVNGLTESGGVRVATGAQPQDGTDWQPYGVNQAGQQVWTQSVGPGNPSLQAYIAKGAQGSGLSYQPTTTGSNLGVIRAPDFVNFQLDYFVGSVWGTFTRDGNSFIGGGLNMGIPNPVGAGVSISAGYLNAGHVSPGQTNNFAGGYAGGGSALYGGFGGGIMISPGNGTATVVGFGAGTTVGKTDNPASVGWGYTVDQGKTGIKW
ncbi:hemagglutinin repeat-containing protein [Caballeronia sp. LZ002]|nr:MULTISPECIES: hemagglutinin repeat-containing protein [unclassified Caballeronia]MDR5777538.1 hemagglutinin repeat-containing protein [Caballeronia sp. LZ002]MDR5852979.1 hemagglutinin repeat-containing protein [Caballeronia sp. LZ003]